MRRRGVRASLCAEGGGSVYDWDDHMSSADWVWMSLSMGIWLLVLGAVVYVAVLLATSDRRR